MTNKLIDKALAGEELTILTGPQSYSFLDVRDAASAITAACISDPIHWAEIYNLGTNEVYTLEEIANEIAEVNYKKLHKSISVAANKSEKQFNASLNIDKFRNTFDWFPAYTLNETLNWIYMNK